MKRQKYEEKQKELDGTANPIEQKLYSAAGGAYRVLLLWRVRMRVSGGRGNAGFEVDVGWGVLDLVGMMTMGIQR